MIKKIIAALLVLLLLFGLVSCFRKEDEGTESDTEQDTLTESGIGEETDTETETETEVESDTETDTEEDTETETETEKEEDTEMDTEKDTEKEEDTETDTEDDTEEDTDKDDPPAKLNTLTLNSSAAGIKILGDRILGSDSQINCDWTCSGIEFVLESIGKELIVKASSDKPCYFRAYVDGIEWSDLAGRTYHVVNGPTDIKLAPIPKGTRTVRLIKVTGHTLARAELLEIGYYGAISETAPAKKDTYIEFIGDSISCGWGVIGDHDGTYTSQDGTMAYPYLIAKELNADYAITALSGQGVIFHGTNMPNMTEGYLCASPIRDNSVAYEFERKADAVVVNIGTNDFIYKVSEAEFREAYKALIETVREKNGEDCKIICIYNTMNDTYSSSIIDVCRELGGQSEGIYYYKLDRANSGHPTESENREYVKVLKEVVKDALDGVVTEMELTTESNGDGMSMDFVTDMKPLN